MQHLKMVAFGLFLDPTKVKIKEPSSVCFMLLQAPKVRLRANLFVSSSTEGLLRRFIRDESGVHFDKPSLDYDQKDFVSIPVKTGSLVVIHGDLIHQRLLLRNLPMFIYAYKYLFFKYPHSVCIALLIPSFVWSSFENRSPESRHAYSLHVVDTDGCKWAQDNWLVLQ